MSRRRDRDHGGRGTGPDLLTAQLVQFRFGGRCCRCGRFGPRMSIQHRKPRKMGGTRRAAINSPANLLWVCGDGTSGCHGHMESYREQAYEAGWLVHDWCDPAVVPVVLWDGRRVLLDAVGGWMLHAAA